jgi:vacuolar-type H+-ATPase subunit H
MSATEGEKPAPQPVSRAAELAAQQVESIVAAAQQSAQKLAEAARAEAESAREEAASVRALAKESAQADVEAARKEAAARIKDAQEAADEVLAEAKAVSGGMRQLAHLLTTHAERILRDVTNSHRAMSADLRAAARNEPPPEERASQEPAAPAEAGEGGAESRAPRRPRRAPSSSAGNPLADLEPPSWVEN